MKVKSVIATVAILISAGSSFAESLYGDAPDASYKSTLTRAQVVQELRIAQANGEIVSGEMYGSEMHAFKSTLPRSVVVAELKAAQGSGEALYGELYGEQPSIVANNRTRLAIRVEAVAFARAHHGHGMNEVYSGD